MVRPYHWGGGTPALAKLGTGTYIDYYIYEIYIERAGVEGKFAHPEHKCGTGTKKEGQLRSLREVKEKAGASEGQMAMDGSRLNACMAFQEKKERKTKKKGAAANEARSSINIIINTDRRIHKH